MNSKVSNAEIKKNNSNSKTAATTTRLKHAKMTTATTTSGFIIPAARTKTTVNSRTHAAIATAAAGVGVGIESNSNNTIDIGSDALCCATEPQPIPPRAAPRANPPTPKPRSVLPPPATTTTTSKLSSSTLKGKQDNMEPNTTPRSKQRLIEVDYSLLLDDDNLFDDETLIIGASTSSAGMTMSICSQPKMPPYPLGGYMMNPNGGAGGVVTGGGNAAQHTAQIPVLRRTTYDLATQCESRRASMRRHTIVGCQSNFDETHSMPPSRPESRQSEEHSNTIAASCTQDNGVTKKQLNNNYNQQQQHLKRSKSPNNGDVEIAIASSNCSNSSSSVGGAGSVGPWKKSFLDEKTWNERGDDRLSLTLEEIVHIRSVMTKAELEGLPVGVRVKEDVEKRKVCFLCLRTRFSIFGPWGIQCKVCQRTVCSKCYTKMRIPSEHFRNVPLVLISPSLLSSPAGSSTPSPSHQAQHYHRHAHSSSTGNILDETFPKSLIERLLRTESERKARNSVGSAPSSPKHQRSNMSTPGIIATGAAAAAPAAGQAVEALQDTSSTNAKMTSSYTAGTTNAASSYANGTLNSGNSTYNNKENAKHAQATNKHISIMSRSMEGPRSLPANSPARPHSNSSTLDRRSKFPRAFTLSSSGTHLSQEQKENLRCEQVPVCNDCKGLVMEITRSSKQTRSTARNRALQNLTLDLSPVYK